MDIRTVEATKMALSDHEHDHLHLISLYNHYFALQRQITTKSTQRARLLWAINGDRNTSLLNNSIIFENHNTMISHITDSNGQIFFDCMDIEHVFIDHFHELWIEHSPSSFSEIF